MGSEIADLQKKINKQLEDKTKPWEPAFSFLQQQTGIDRQYIFWGFVAFIFLWLAFGYAGQLLTNFIAIVYPAYASIHAIESRAADDDTKWLTYWVVFSGFSFADYFASIILGWFPLYWLVKCLLLVWLMIPTNLNGSLFLYRNIIKPYFLQYHNVVDDVVNKTQSLAKEFVEHLPTKKDS